MNQPYTSTVVYTSYWNFFQHYYTPQLKKIDLLIKTMDGAISIEVAAHALHLSEETIKKIMREKNINLIDKDGLLNIIMHGNSPLCGLLQREFTRGSPSIYSPDDIAYIYGLQKENVERVCQTNSRIPAKDLPKTLDKISIFIMSQGS